MVVFDAYRVQRHAEEIFDYHNIRVVYTKEAQTADHFIEKFAHDNHEKYDITVATSDAAADYHQGSRLLTIIRQGTKSGKSNRHTSR